MRNPLLVGLIVGALIVVATIGVLRVLNIGPLASDTNASISGTFDINGIIPVGATLSVTATEYNVNDAKPAERKNIPAADGQTWSIDGLEKGKNYSVVATLTSEGKTIAKSDTLVVTAPAGEESLRINIETENGAANATISGNVVVNGYIPPGSTITVQGRVQGRPSFTTVASGLPGQAKQFMSYTTAIEGESYEVRGILLNSSGVQIGVSSSLIVTAPAANEVLTINSNAQAPATLAPTASPNQSPTPAAGNQTISGSINFNGAAPSNSRIVILAKVYNSSNYQVVVNNVSPTNGASWTWNGAASSTWYDVMAVLKQSQPNGTDKDIADSQMMSVAAPATNVTLNINSGVQIPAPTGQVSMICGTQSGNSWNATLTLPYVANAQSYWYQVGTSNNSSNVANSTVNANGSNNVQVNVSLPNQQNLYFQYAYANVPNVGTGNSQFSPFSSSSQGICGN